MPVIREAIPADIEAIICLLSRYGLRTEGLLESGSKYWVGEVSGRVIAAIGLELSGDSVLLRSAIVSPEERGKGLAGELTERALNWAAGTGFNRAYCFSTDAGAYWAARGFRDCTVDELVAAMPDAPQVRVFDRLGWLPTEVAYRRDLRGSTKDGGVTIG